MKSILLHIRDDDGLDSRIDAAITLARTFSGHITCLHLTPYHDDLADPLLAAELPADFFTRVELSKLGLRDRIGSILDDAAVSWEWVHRDEPMAGAFVRESMLTDVIVVSLPGRASAHGWSFVASVASSARAPVLAVPKAGPALDLGGPVLVAWDGSPEASVAMRTSLPLLRQASSVRLIEIEEGRAIVEAGQASAYLGRQGIHVVTLHRLAASGDAGHVIIETATKIGARLIVMGAYGHSRLEEYLVGGATRTMLSSSPVALLLAH